ncbi:uncharacterized protein V6R79_000844 [Siganus canaliculatus]
MLDLVLVLMLVLVLVLVPGLDLMLVFVLVPGLDLVLVLMLVLVLVLVPGLDLVLVFVRVLMLVLMLVPVLVLMLVLAGRRPCWSSSWTWCSDLDEMMQLVGSCVCRQRSGGRAQPAPRIWSGFYRYGSDFTSSLCDTNSRWSILCSLRFVRRNESYGGTADAGGWSPEERHRCFHQEVV